MLDATGEAIPSALIVGDSGHPAREACNAHCRHGVPAWPIALTKDIGIAEDTRGTINQSVGTALQSLPSCMEPDLMHRHPVRRATSLVRTSLSDSSGMLGRHRSGPTLHFPASHFGQSIQLIKLQ
ncbi:hypothetical protein [Burkholderia plantarii]|uniref:hypothetical protein n=1 Tax=Burkholderia plantarii TaxID=41899 RepID=UPI0018DCD1D2|nr:hypothetical protein [Burkholderia plantarii]MBI0327859.1 hypothetical protein [Burkholderia plantarii]